MACGAGGHTHNFSIHSPSITSVQLEADMGSTRLCSSGSAACSGPASDVAAMSQAASSAVSSGPQRPPAMLGRGARLLGRACGESEQRARNLARLPDWRFPSSRRRQRGASPPPGRADRPRSLSERRTPSLIGPSQPRPRPLSPRPSVARGVGCLGNSRLFFQTTILKINR